MTVWMSLHLTIFIFSSLGCNKAAESRFGPAQQVFVCNGLQTRFPLGSSSQVLELEAVLRKAELSGQEDAQIAALESLASAETVAQNPDQALRWREQLKRTLGTAADRNVPTETRLNLIRRRAVNLEETAQLHGAAQRFHEARENLLLAKADYERLNDDARVQRLLDQLALHSAYLADYEGALAHALSSVQLAERMQEPARLARALCTLGRVHRDLKNYDLALRYLYESEGIAVRTDDWRNRSVALNEIGNVFLLQGKLEEAAGYKRRTMALAVRLGDPRILSACLHDMGVISFSNEDYNAALGYFQQALETSKRANDCRQTVLVLASIGQLRERRGDYREAIPPYKEALENAERSGLRNEMQELGYSLAGIYYRLGFYKSGFGYLERAYKVREAIFTEEKARHIGELQTKFETERKDRENEILKRDNRIKDLDVQRKRSQRDFLVVTTIMALVLAAVLYNQNRVKTRANRGLALANREIVAQKAALDEVNAQLDTLARTDPLTGLPNRREMTERVCSESIRSQRTSSPFVLILADIDNFKSVNDRFGHHAGDMVLQRVAQELRDSLRTYDSVGRWGGEEFLLLLPETSLLAAKAIADRIHQCIGELAVPLEGHELKLTMTFGVLGCDDGTRSIEECLKAADRALYQGKAEGKNRVVVRSARRRTNGSPGVPERQSA